MGLGFKKLWCCAVLSLALAGCQSTADQPGDGEFDSFPTGKADGALDPGSDQALAVLLLVNDPEVDFAELDDDARLNRRAARNIIDHRDGADAMVGTDDDDTFGDLLELDMVPYVGPYALGQLLAYAIAQGYLDQIQNRPEASAEVIFSPQPSWLTHNARVAELIAQAQDSIDIAMYSFGNAEIGNALEDASLRGVQIRFLFESAKRDRKLEGNALQSSKSGRLEADDIDVRWVNKIMHHKFMIIDGPRDDLATAVSAMVVSGSANWSNSAGTRYDENTLFLQGHEELTLRLQQEFNFLWNHSRDLVSNEDLVFTASSVEIEDADITDRADSHAWFTSDNFDLSNPTTFRKTGRNTVSEVLIAAIEDADTSIHLASGHLRHRAISEAIIAKAAASPEVEILVYLDAQEYISATTHQIQLDKLDDCLAEATTATQERNCTDKGFRFGYLLGTSGVDVRYKWYSYRWHYTYAAQMHHKYMIIDGDELWTGSYNLSDNAEHNTFENMLQFNGDEHADLIAAYEANFAQIRETGRAEDLLAQVSETIATAAVIPMVFDSMALEHAEVNALKTLIRTNCALADTNDFRRNPQDHRQCQR